MPFIAYDLDALDAAPHVARASGITDDAAVAGNARLWAWCWKAKTDVVAPAHLAGFYGSERVASAMVAFGFLEVVGDGFRVRGAERYLRLQAARSKGGRASKGNLRQGKSSPATAGTQPELQPGNSPGSVPALSSNIEHRTSRVETFAGTASPPPAALKPPRHPKPEKPSDPRHAPMVKALVELSPGYGFSGRDARAVTELLALGPDEEIQERWRRALGRSGFPIVRTLPELATHWNHFATDEPPRSKPIDVTRGMVRAQDVDKKAFEKVGVMHDF